VLARSFRAHHPDIPFYVLLADEVDGYFDPDLEPFHVILLSSLAIPERERFQFHYAQQPLSYAVTPFLLEYLLDRGFSHLIFFKQESLVLGDHLAVLDLLGQHPIVLTPHLLAPLDGPDRISRELNVLQSGIFNVGLLGVAAGDTARRFLRWWQERTYAHCRHAVADGMHYEQRWLDLVPAFFASTHVLRDPAFNVAHWNLPERSIAIHEGAVLVDGRPCRLFRFSGYDPDAPRAPTRYSPRLTWENLGPARELFERYGRALEEDGYSQTRHWPYAYGTFDNGVVIPDFVRHLYRQLDNPGERFGDPRRTVKPSATGTDRTAGASSPTSDHSPKVDSFYQWLNEPVEGSAATITRLWHAVYLARPDLQDAFPDVFGTDCSPFVEWTASSGLREHGFPDAFMNPGHE
jgi:hypothetical protein